LSNQNRSSQLIKDQLKPCTDWTRNYNHRDEICARWCKNNQQLFASESWIWGLLRSRNRVCAKRDL